MELRLFIIEPESLRRRLVCGTAEAIEELVVVGFADSLAAEAVALADHPDIFLVNAALLASQREHLRSIAALYPEAYFVLFDGHPDLTELLDCVELPVRGFLSFNHLASAEFGRALQTIAHGGAVIEPVSAQLLLAYLHDSAANGTRLSASTGPGLTEREQDVLALVRQGMSNKEIALRLSISLGTVRAHLRSVFRKLDVTSRAGAAVSSMSPSSGRGDRIA